MKAKDGENSANGVSCCGVMRCNGGSVLRSEVRVCRVCVMTQGLRCGVAWYS